MPDRSFETRSGRTDDNLAPAVEETIERLVQEHPYLLVRSTVLGRPDQSGDYLAQQSVRLFRDRLRA